MKTLRCDFEVVKVERDAVTIRDRNNGRMSVTNDAENVVLALREQGLLPEGRRLFYIDSMGSLDEILVNERGFIGFRPGTGA
jgi:hypothetical protein